MRFFFKWKEAYFDREGTGLEKQGILQAHTLFPDLLSARFAVTAGSGASSLSSPTLMPVFTT